MTRDEIITAVHAEHRAGNDYWSAFPTHTFFAPLGEAWSPAENVRHLIKSSRPVVTALKAPRLLLRFRFGAAKRPSMSFDELVATYRARLDKGADAGAYAPSKQAEPDLEAWRAKIMSQRKQVHDALVEQIAKWSEPALDRYQLPHPLIGDLTLREMLYFTINHERHHRGVVERRLKPA